MSRYDVDTDSLSFDFVYRPTPSDHGGSIKCVALQVSRVRIQSLSIAKFTQPFRQLLQIKPADMGSYVNYFIERKNGDVAGDDPEFVPPMVGESEVVFTTVEAVPVRGRIRSPLLYLARVPFIAKVRGQRSNNETGKVALTYCPRSTSDRQFGHGAFCCA